MDDIMRRNPSERQADGGKQVPPSACFGGGVRFLLLGAGLNQVRKRKPPES